jgi:hypothetical protein
VRCGELISRRVKQLRLKGISVTAMVLLQAVVTRATPASISASAHKDIQMIPYIGPEMAKALTNKSENIESDSQNIANISRAHYGRTISRWWQVILELRDSIRFASLISLILRLLLQFVLRKDVVTIHRMTGVWMNYDFVTRTLLANILKL